MTELPLAEKTPLARGQEVSGYRVRVHLGSGPHGEIWSGVEPLTGAKVAIKQLPASADVESWFAERAARPAEGLTRPVAVGRRSDGQAYVVRDFAPGRSLRQISEAGLAAPDARALLDELSRLLTAAHRVGLVHGHLVADNIFVSPPAQPGGAPRLTLTDAGLAALDGHHMEPSVDLRALARLRRQLVERGAHVQGPAAPDVSGAASNAVDVARPTEGPTPAGFRQARRRSGAGWTALRILLWLFLCAASVGGTYRVLVGSWPGAHAGGAAQREARLELRSQPPGALVFLDGRRLAPTTPLTTTVLRGRPYRLVLTHAGHRNYAQTVALGVDETHRRLEIRLEGRPQEWGTLKLSANVQADFFLDGRCVGLQATQVTLADVRAGVAHQVRVQAPGRRLVERSVRVLAGKVAVQDFDLERLSITAKLARRPVGLRAARGAR